MPNSKVLIAVLALAAAGACKKKEAPPAAASGSGSSAPISAKVTVTATGSAQAPAGSAAPAAAHVDPGCKPGAYVHTNPDWCAEIPADFKLAQEDKEAGFTLLTFESSDGPSLNFKWYDDHDAQSDIEYVHAYAHPTDKTMKSIANGDVPNGAYYHIQYASGVHEVNYVFTGKNADVTCQFQTKNPDQIAKFEAICKSVKVP